MRIFSRLTYFFAAMIILHATNVCVQPTQSTTQQVISTPLKKDIPKALEYLTTTKEKIESSLIESEDCLWPRGNQTYRQAMLQIMHCSNYCHENPSPAVNQCAALLEDYLLALSHLPTELLEQNGAQVSGCTRKTLLALSAATKEANEAEVVFKREIAELVTFIKNDFLPPAPIYPKKVPLTQRTKNYVKNFVEQHKIACKIAAATVIVVCMWALWKKYHAQTPPPIKPDPQSTSEGKKTSPAAPAQTPKTVIEQPAIPRQNGSTQCGYHSSCNSIYVAEKLKQARDKKGSKLTQEEVIAVLRNLTTDLTDEQTQALLDEAKKTLGFDAPSDDQTVKLLEDATLPTTKRIEARRAAFRANVTCQIANHRVLLEVEKRQLDEKLTLTRTLKASKEAYDSASLEEEKNRLERAIKAHKDAIGALEKNLNEGACLDGNGVFEFVTKSLPGIEYDACSEGHELAWQQCEISNSPTPKRLAAAREVLEKLNADPTLARTLYETATALKIDDRWPDQPEEITLASGIKLNEIQELIDITKIKDRWPTELKLIDWFQKGYTLVLNWLDHPGPKYPGAVGHWTSKVIIPDTVPPTKAHVFHLDSFGSAPSESFKNLLTMLLDPKNLFTDDDIEMLRSVIPE